MHAFTANHHAAVNDSALPACRPCLLQINSSTERLRRQLQDMHVTALMVTASQAFMDNPLQVCLFLFLFIYISIVH